MSNLVEMLSLAVNASLSRHTIRSLSASNKRLNKEKKKCRNFIIDSLDKGEIKWKTLKEEK